MVTCAQVVDLRHHMPIGVELRTLMTENDYREPGNESYTTLTPVPSKSMRQKLAISFFFFGLINNGINQ